MDKTLKNLRILLVSGMYPWRISMAQVFEGQARETNYPTVEINFLSLNMFVQEYINGHYPGFLTLCKSHHVSKIYAFGSATGKNFNAEKSDIDLIVEIDENDPLKKGNDLLLLWDELELFFHRKVDVLTPSSIKNPVLKENIERSKVLLYAR